MTGRTAKSTRSGLRVALIFSGMLGMLAATHLMIDARRAEVEVGLERLVSRMIDDLCASGRHSRRIDAESVCNGNDRARR